MDYKPKNPWNNLLIMERSLLLFLRLNYTYLDIEVPRMYRFIPGHPKIEGTVLDEKRKKSLLTIVLESLHKDEAELLVKAITKKDLGVKFLTSRIIKEAYSDINIP